MTTSNARKPFGGFLHDLSDKVNTLTEAVLFATLVIMVIITILQVVFRFFFDALTWSEEAACFLLVFASLLGTAVAFKKGNHIAVTFLVDKMALTGKKVAQTLIALLGMVFFGIVAFYGAYLMKVEAGQLTPALLISMKWIYLQYPLVGSIIVLHLVDSIVKTWEGR